VIIFWIFTLFVGASTFAFTFIFLQLGMGWSVADALVAMLICRGILSMVRRSLILRERISPETDVLTRTVETNRAIFWKRALFLAAIPVLYFAGAYYLFGLEPVDGQDQPLRAPVGPGHLARVLLPGGEHALVAADVALDGVQRRG